jgi:multidrug efflux system membrane fusion protein
MNIVLGATSLRLKAVKGVALASLLVGILLLPACSKKNISMKEGGAPVPVTVASVVQKNVPVEVRAIGTGESYSSVAMKSMVNGEIIKVNFIEGQDVKKGDLLFVLDSRPYEAVIKQAEAALARDVAQEKNARDQAERYQRLYEQGIMTQESADQYRTTYDTLEKSMLVDKAAIETNRVQLSYCSIYAPIDGRTGSLLIHEGNVVKANDTTSMVIINQISPFYVDFSVPEQFLPEIKKHLSAGQKLKVKAMVPKDDGPPEEGFLSFINNTVDAATGTILLKGTFQNTQRRLWPGQFVNVVMTLSTQPDAIVVPTQAIQTGQNGQFVFVLKSDQTVEARPISVGQALDGETIISKGVQVGETVVTDGQLRLAPGAKVQIKAGLQAPDKTQ